MTTAQRPRVTSATVVAVLAALLAALAVAAPPRAEAAEEFLLTGRGNGHGIGMSQYGARGQAMEGRSSAQILATYYPGTGLTTRTAPYDARIGVVLDQPRTQIVPPLRLFLIP